MPAEPPPIPDPALFICPNPAEPNTTTTSPRAKTGNSEGGETNHAAFRPAKSLEHAGEGQKNTVKICTTLAEKSEPKEKSPQRIR